MAWLQSLLKPVAYVSVPLFTLKYVAVAFPVTRYYVRMFLYLSALGICSTEGILVAIWMAIIGQRFNTKYYIARSFYLLCGNLLDIKIVVEGEEHLNVRPAVMVGNHQSFIDILYLGRIFPKRASIMAKTSIKFMPLLGQWMWIAGTIFVDRSKDRRKAVEQLKQVGEVMKAQHTSLWMFPEGTRSMRQHDDLLPFKKGAFHLAIESGLPIIPVVCENYWRLYRKSVFESGTLKVRVLPPIQTAGLTTDDATALSERTRDIMLQALKDISRSPPASAKSQEAVKERTQKPLQPAAPASSPKVRVEPAQALAGSAIGAAPLAASDVLDSPRQGTQSVASSRDTGGETEDEGWTKVPGSSA
ncbi:1-acylglycerol-3-phosphate O [Auriculariales sp. MPI-PUGE-AT-0066]|nr:1-acylglycerol-3-phosphate O [Auriculariales sp. MPI-PUGE-AT-0066]